MSHNKYDGIRYRDEKSAPLVFKLLLSALLIWGIIFITYYLTSDWSSQKEYADNKAKMDEILLKNRRTPSGVPAVAPPKLPHEAQEKYVQAGQKVFVARCAVCHGGEARGGIGPDLHRTEFKYGKTFEALTETIRGGRPGGMPPFANELNHEQIEGLVEYILSLK